ncbi:MAG: tetratricopeptide repeat protein [Bacteroidales bacterium]
MNSPQKITLSLLIVLTLGLMTGISSTTTVDTSSIISFLNSDSARRMHPSMLVNLMADKINDTTTARLIILKIDDEGYRQRNLGNYQKALFYHHMALSFAYRFNVLQLQARIYNNIGVVYRRMDDYEPALHYHLQALRLAEMTGARTSKAIALNSIGNINYMMGKYDLALKYFLQAYSIERHDQRLRGLAINLNNIANVYKAKGDTLMALRLYDQSLKINEQIGDIRGIGICHNDLGTLYLARGMRIEALESFQKAYDYFKQTNDLRFVAEVSRNLGLALLKNGKLTEAEDFLKKSVTLTSKIEAKWEEEASLKALAEYYHAKGNNTEAYMLLTRAYHLRDKIDKESAAKNISNAQAVFMLEQTEKEKEYYQNLSNLSEQKLHREKQLRFITSLIIFIAMATIGIVYLIRRRYTRSLKEKNRQLQIAKDELKDYSHKLEEALEKAEASGRAKSVFLANISHEFRTPLNAITGFASLLKAQAQSEDERKLLDIIIQSSNNLLDLVTDLLNVSAVEAGILEIKEKPVDLRALLRETESVFKLWSQQKSIDFELEIASSLPDFILSDEGRLRQVIYNLTGNAVKFTMQGKVKVAAWCEKDAENSEMLIISVKDTGPGIAPEELERIFEPFFQGRLLGGEPDGVGLGLSIVRKIIEMMGGQIVVHSNLGQGSEFRLIIKNVKKVKVLRENISAEGKGQLPQKVVKGVKALVVDDLEVNRLLLASFLEKMGIQVIHASNGPEAILKAKVYQPSLAFIDIRMPGMNGFECARQLRQQTIASAMTIIAVTASVFGKELEDLSKPPFNAYLLKPVEYNSFIRLIENFIPAQNGM